MVLAAFRLVVPAPESLPKVAAISGGERIAVEGE